MTRQRHPQSAIRRADFLLLLGAVLLLALYPLLRYGGLWGEVDSSVFTAAIRAMIDSGELIPTTGSVYPNGYGYQVLIIYLIHATGLSLSSWQLIGSVLLMVWLLFPAWLLYRELTGTSRAAVLATVLLFIEPEFLFPVLRATHEKFTRGLMLLALYLLMKSLRSRSDFNRFASWVLAFYLTSYALITFNNLFATSFIVSVGLALVLSWGTTRGRWPRSEVIWQRLGYATMISVMLALVFTFYAYQPARHNILLLQSIWERLAALFLDVEHASSNPYTTVNVSWISLPVYFMVSLANWLLLGASAMIWLSQSVTLFWRKQQRQGENETNGRLPSEESDALELLLWAFYGAFAFMALAAIVVDLSGAIAGNLQHRIFPSFAMLATPVVAKWLTEYMPSTRLAYGLLWTSIAVLAVLSTLKATNEPLLSQKWLFYLPSEMKALNWAEKALPNQTVWTAYDERLTAADRIRSGATPRHLRLDDFTVDLGTRDFLISDLIRLRSIRLSQPLPMKADSFMTYDNGQTQIFHLRPRTPYQK